MMDIFQKDFLIKIIVEPACAYLAMVGWHWYATGRGWAAKWAYRAEAGEFLGKQERMSEGFKEFCYSVACNPIDYAWAFVAIALIIGVVGLVNNNYEGKYESEDE